MPDVVLAVLAGLMLGSLRALWPFHRHLPGGGETAALPVAADPATGPAIAMFATGFAAVTALEWAGRRAARGRSANECPRQDSNLGPTA